MSAKSDRAWAEAMGLSVEEFQRRFTPWKTRGKTMPTAEPPTTHVVKSKPSPSMRAHVIKRDGCRCRYCAVEVIEGGRGPQALTIDHVIPRSRGGTNAQTNLVVACQACNQEKAQLLAGEWQHPLPVTNVAAIMRTSMPDGSCPDCTDGYWASDGRACTTCDAAGVLTTERAVWLFVEARNATRTERKRRDEIGGELRRLKRIVEEEMGPGSARRDLASTVNTMSKTIAQMSEAILRLKVQVAELGGGELDRMIPNPKQREQALQLVQGGAGDEPR